MGLNFWDELFRMISLVENICYEMSEMNLQNELSLIKYLRMNCLRLSASDTVSEMQCQGWIYRTNCFGWIAVNKMFRNECFGMNYLGRISRIHYFEWIVRDVISRINLKKELQIKADKISGKKCLVMNYCLAWNIWDKMYQLKWTFCRVTIHNYLKQVFYYFQFLIARYCFRPRKYVPLSRSDLNTDQKSNTKYISILNDVIIPLPPGLHFQFDANSSFRFWITTNQN